MVVHNCGLIPESPYFWCARRPEVRGRLICFPHAGAGASSYADWVAWLPDDIELVAVQLPGRQDRVAEEPFTEVEPLVRAVAEGIAPILDRPFAFFGHSTGAALAYEVAKELRAQEQSGLGHLFLSGQPSPGVRAGKELYRLPDDAFRKELVQLGGINAEIAADEYVMSAVLPVVRTDFVLWEPHLSKPDTPLDCPITALVGTTDPRAPEESMRGWREQTTATFAMRRFTGGHFYFMDSLADLVSFVGAQAREALAAGAAK
ncbi:thioesterase II family protein [Nocardia sp. NPDC060256]|uniref:thioesterase II family protein n=1 Tax=unclassified Nocardia TaxID=2637762 RepID=UPI0036593B23